MRTKYCDLLKSMRFTFKTVTIALLLTSSANAATSLNSNQYYGPDYSSQFTNMQTSLSEILRTNQSTLSPLSGRLEEISQFTSEISKFTFEILDRVNSIPEKLDLITKLAASWLAEYQAEAPDTRELAETQVIFADLGNQFATQASSFDAQQPKLMGALLKSSPINFTTPEDSPKILQDFPNVNDLNYLSVMNQALVPTMPVSAYNYVKNVAGLNIPHQRPLPTWSGNSSVKKLYKSYYESILAIDSYTAYLLSRLIVNSESNDQQKVLQNNLITKASSSSWLTAVTSKELGKVLRDILIFQSQSYVLLSQLVKLQEEMLTAQAMNNSLQIITSIGTEADLARRASGSV